MMKNMKHSKNIGIAALLLLALMLVPAAFAEENTTGLPCDCNLTEQDQNEIADFDVLPGAEMRFLQLQRTISRNILVGTTVVEVIEKNHPESNTTNLKIILGDMEVLLNETKNVDLQGMEPSQIATEYVSIKKQAINLTHEFRNEARAFLNATDISEIHANITGVNNSFQDLNEMIRNMRKEMNAYRVNHTFACMNFTNTTYPELDHLLERIREGNITLNEIEEAVKNIFGNLSAQEKIDSLKGARSCAVMRAEIKNEIRDEIHSQLPSLYASKMGDIISRRLEIASNRMQIASNMIEVRSRIMNQTNHTLLSARMQNLSNLMEQRSERLENWSSRMDHLREKARTRAAMPVGQVK